MFLLPGANGSAKFLLKVMEELCSQRSFEGIETKESRETYPGLPRRWAIFKSGKEVLELSERTFSDFITASQKEVLLC